MQRDMRKSEFLSGPWWISRVSYFGGLSPRPNPKSGGARKRSVSRLLEPLTRPRGESPGVHYVRPGVGILGADFGREELRHVGAAAGSLILIFTAGFVGGIARPGFLLNFVFVLPYMLVAAPGPFLLALWVQKRVGARSGCTIEFRVQSQWLFLSLFFAGVLGWIFAIPGTLLRFGNLTRSAAGKMGLAGPATLIAVAFGARIAAEAVGPGAGWVAFAFVLVGWVNSLLAIFQSIPLPGFPGYDVWRWSKLSFAIMIAFAVAAFLFTRTSSALF